MPFAIFAEYPGGYVNTQAQNLKQLLHKLQEIYSGDVNDIRREVQGWAVCCTAGESFYFENGSDAERDYEGYIIALKSSLDKGDRPNMQDRIPTLYLNLIQELDEIRYKNHGEDSPEEDSLMDRLDQVWEALAPEQIEGLSLPEVTRDGPKRIDDERGD